MNGEPILRLRAVRHRYGQRLVLRLESIDVPEGEIVCLMGPTGAGKSTLLRLLCGVEAPTTGTLAVSGRESGAEAMPPEIRRRITMVFQHPMLLSGSVRYNVEYGLRLRRQSGARRAAENILDRLGIPELAGRAVHSLSGGQRQLVALARAMVIEPRILILDEPTANLDPATVALVEALILEENRVRGITVVWATHYPFQARRVSHRTGLLLEGSLVELAPTLEFFERPRDSRTDAFVRGEMIY